MQTMCSNLIRETKQRVQFRNLYSFSSLYQPPSIENIRLSEYQESCLHGDLVDKSQFIYEVQNFRKNLLITRPRRWGKTLSLQMLKAFYGYTENASVQNFNRKLFLGGHIVYDNDEYRLPALKVSENKDFCAKYLGRYPIIHITLQGLKLNSKEEVKNMIYESMAKAYRQHIHLFRRMLLDEINEFTQEQKQSIYDYANLPTKEYPVLYKNWQKYANPNSPHSPWLKLGNIFLTHTPPNEINEMDIQTSIGKLSTILTEYYQKPSCMLLIDEYDLPFNNLLTESMKSGKYEVLKFLQDLLNSMFQYGVKYNEEIHKIIIFGILPLASVEQSDGWNFLFPCTVESGDLEKSFGYTQEEVDKEIQNLTQIPILEKPCLKEKIRDFYNGYTIGNTHLYNPFSVSNCLIKVRSGLYSKCLQPFWNSTGSLLFLENLFKQLDRTQLEKLVNNRFHDHKSFSQILTWSGIVNDTSALVPVLWHLGYLTFENPTSLRLPNIEVTSVLKNAIYPYYLKSLRESYPLIWSELDKSLENISDYFEKIQTLAIPEFNREFQETQRDISESHFTAMLSANSLTSNHRIVRIQEQTKKNKRIDMIYELNSVNGNAIIIHELKVNQQARNKSKFKEELLDDAIWQIFGNLYPLDRLQEFGATAEQLICRVLLLSKIKTNQGEQYQFEGLGYKFSINEANELMKLFGEYDEYKRAKMFKGMKGVTRKDRKQTRSDFLDHCHAQSLSELLKRYE